MPHSGGAFFSKRSTGIFFRAEGCRKNIFAGKLKYGLAILPEYKVKAHVLKLFYAVRAKFSFCPHFLSGNFILRNICQLLHFYLQALLYFWRVRQKSPLSLSKNSRRLRLKSAIKINYRLYSFLFFIFFVWGAVNKPCTM